MKFMNDEPTVITISRVAWTLSILSSRVHEFYEDADDRNVSKQLHELHLVLRLCVLALGGEPVLKQALDDAQAAHDESAELPF